jgi:hypothetical protein
MFITEFIILGMITMNITADIIAFTTLDTILTITGVEPMNKTVNIIGLNTLVTIVMISDVETIFLVMTLTTSSFSAQKEMNSSRTNIVWIHVIIFNLDYVTCLVNKLFQTITTVGN